MDYCLMKPCKFYIKGNCKDGINCKFDHIDNICRKFFFDGKCNLDSCKFSHEYKLEGNSKNKQRHKKKNTESFEPDHSGPDLRVMIGNNKLDKYNYPHQENDVVLVNDLFNDSTIYDKLLIEIEQTGDTEKIWKLWHGDSHYIADDKRGNWKQECPTFSMIVERLSKYFDMDVKATRFNWYRYPLEWKPYHHDAAAVDPKKAESQNLTVGVSFGSTRDIAFQHAKTRTVVSIPQPDGMVYTFGKKVNIDWRHGIPQIKNPTEKDKGRISIILWGKNEQI